MSVAGIPGGPWTALPWQRLLSDIAAGRIDVVVVKKIDRLTRSLFDFAKIVEAFDAKGVSFVSVTSSSTPRLATSSVARAG